MGYEVNTSLQCSNNLSPGYPKIAEQNQRFSRQVPRRLESRIRGFEGTCRRGILRIWWERTVTSREVWKRVGINDIAQEVKKRRWKWLGHVLRMKKDRHPYAALTWAPPGKRDRGRPLGTWRPTTEAEMEEAGKTWDELRWLAQDQPEWRSSVNALGFTGSEEG